MTSDSGELTLKGARHPLVERKRGNFVANDAKFERGKRHFHILTGPNMGGKSTYMRSVGERIFDNILCMERYEFYISSGPL